MKALAALLTVLLLAGCSGLRVVESQVSATPANGARIETGARYRFERLPSSQQDPAAAEALETIAEAELGRVGLVRDNTAPAYSVQLGTRMTPYLVDDWGRPYGNAQVGGAIFIGRGSFAYGSGLGMRFPPSTQYRHELSLLLRDLASNQLVYETSAVHEGPWNDQHNILRALLQAALQGFPHPPPGPRRVAIEIPR